MKGKPEPKAESEAESEAESKARRTFTALDITEEFLSQIPKEQLDAVVYLMTIMVYCDGGVIYRWYIDNALIVSATYPAHL